MVYPAYIPARDQTVVYGAQISASFQRAFKPQLGKELGSDPDTALATSSRVAQLIWQAYAFLAPGGRPYDPGHAVRAQLGQSFGCQTAISYVVKSARATSPDAPVSLSKIFQDPTLNHSEWVRSAKTRVAETLFLERLLMTIRELKMADES